MKYLLDKDYSFSCIYEGRVTQTLSFVDKQSSRIDVSNKQTTDEIIGYARFFQTYSSPYSGAFDLLDTQYIPRPCATSSANLTQMDYFYG